MKINVYEDRTVYTQSVYAGSQDENNAEILEFEFEEDVSEYDKFIEFEVDDKKFVDRVENNRYVVTNAITKYEKVYAQLVLKNISEQVTFKTRMFMLKFNKSINATEDIEVEERTLIETLILDIRRTNDKVDEFAEKVIQNTEAIEELENISEEYNINIQNIETSQVQQNARIVELETDNETNKSEIIELNEKVATNKTDIETLQENARNYALVTESGSKINLRIDENTYIITFELLDKQDNVLSAKNIDLPLESMVVNATFKADTKEVELVLKNNEKVYFSVAELVRRISK